MKLKLEKKYLICIWETRLIEKNNFELILT